MGEDHFGINVPDEAASNCIAVADLLVRKGRQIE